MELEYGATFYQVTYADPKLTIPGFKPMVFVGENIFGNEEVKTFYFQDTISVLIFGLVGEAKDTTDCQISSFKEDDLGSGIVSMERAAEIMNQALKKSKELGYPKIVKASSKWQ